MPTLPLIRTARLLLLFAFALPVQAQRFAPVTSSPVVTETLTSGGATWFDVDGDGALDLFVANGNVGSQPNSLFLNDGSGDFTVAPNAGDLLADSESSIGGTAGDYDGDGDDDLFVTNRGQGAGSATPTRNALYRNDGGTFTRVTDGPVGTDAEDSNSSSWVDIDSDGDLDLFVTNFKAANFLYRNDDGTLVRAEASPITSVVENSINGSWADLDNDGDPDYFMGNGNDGIADDRLYRNDGGLSFSTTAFSDGVSTLGSSWGDIDNDGDLDLFVAHFLGQDNALYLNAGPPDYTLAPAPAGPVTTGGGNSTGSSWGDVDNDGDLDLFVSNFRQGNALYLNAGPPDYTFAESPPEAVTTDGGDSFGNALADYDADGDLDLFVANLNDQANFLYENRTEGTGAWLQFDLIGEAPNTTAIGARVYVQATINGAAREQLRVVEAQSGYNSQTTRLHVGLGDATTADIRVLWPSGLSSTQLDVPVNQTLRIEQKSTASEETGHAIDVQLDVYPNPAVQSTTVDYAVGETGRVRLIVHDLLGRTVRVLADGVRARGPHRITWDGRDGAGNAVAPGTYLLSITQDDETRSRVLTRLR